MYCTWKRTKWRAIRAFLFTLTLVTAMLFSTAAPAFAADLNDPTTPSVPATDHQPTVMAAVDPIIPTYEEAYQRMTGLQEKYPEGMTWTNSDPYGPGKEAGESYSWKGGLIEGKRIVSVGCAAFAFILSDEAFGSLPNRAFRTGAFKFEDVKVGDILRINGNTHVVIVLQVTAGGAIIAEGNYNGTVHWGRAMSKAEVENADLLLTRYPESYSEDTGSDDITASGNEGSLNWSLTKSGILTISGTGAIPDYSVNEQQYPSWNSHKDQINTVVIEEGITEIGDYTFYQNSNLLSVYIPEGVSSIGISAFQECGLVAVTIPGTVTSIGASAFRKCGNLTSASVSEGLETIGDNAFQACTALQYIDFPASIKTVGAAAFTSCSSMISIRFKPGTENATIGANAFTQCQGLIFVTLPQNLGQISEGMFSSCTSLSSIYIPASVNDIRTSPFTGTRLQYGGTLYYGGSETDWINAGGKMVLNAMPNMNIEYNVTFDDPFDVEDGDGLVEDPEEPKEHEHRWTDSWSSDAAAHWHECVNDNCDVTDNSQKNGYEGHSFGDWVTDAEPTATTAGSRHKDCTTCGYRQTDSIPVSTGDSGNNGNGAGSANGTNQPPQNTPLAKGKTFKANNITYKITKAGAEVQLTTSKSTAKKVTVNTVTGTDGVKYKVTSIGSKAMQNNKKMTSLTIGANVKTIGANAFSGCTKLTAVTFGKNVTTIGTSAFKGCTALKKLTLPDSVKTVSANAFSGCTKLTAATIGKTSKSSLTTIGKSAFNGCKKLSKVTIKSTKLRSSGKQAFKNTKSSLKVKVPSKQLTKYKKILKKAGLKTKQITK